MHLSAIGTGSFPTTAAAETLTPRSCGAPCRLALAATALAVSRLTAATTAHNARCRDHWSSRSLVVATTALLAATCRRHHSGAVRRRDHVRYVPDVVRIVVSISVHQSYSFMLFLRQIMQPPGRKRGRLPLDDVTNCNAKGFTLSFQVYVSLLNLTSAPSGHMLVTSRSHSNCRL